MLSLELWAGEEALSRWTPRGKRTKRHMVPSSLPPAFDTQWTHSHDSDHARCTPLTHLLHCPAIRIKLSHQFVLTNTLQCVCVFALERRNDFPRKFSSWRKSQNHLWRELRCNCLRFSFELFVWEYLNLSCTDNCFQMKNRVPQCVFLGYRSIILKIIFWAPYTITHAACAVFRIKSRSI